MIIYNYLHYSVINNDLPVISEGCSIPISSITSIRPSRNPISSPALSLRRLSIRYNKYDEILVSPKDREAFVAALKAANPQILTEN